MVILKIVPQETVPLVHSEGCKLENGAPSLEYNDFSTNTHFTHKYLQFTTDRITTFPNRFMEKLINSNSKTSSNDISISYITVQQSQFTALNTFTVNNLTTFY